MVEGGDDVCAGSGMAMLVAAEFGGGAKMREDFCFLKVALVFIHLTEKGHDTMHEELVEGHPPSSTYLPLHVLHTEPTRAPQSLYPY